MTQELLFEIKESAAIITLNRPSSFNALSAGLRAELRQALQRADRDEGVRSIILTGAGDRAFCAGLDLKELQTEPGTMTAIVSRNSPDNMAEAFARLKKPVICAVNGVAITGGLELVLCCDLVIASKNAVFADTHAVVGAMPAWGLSQRLSRLIGPMRAKHMSLTAQKISATQALAWGLVSEVVDQEELIPRALELAAHIGGLHQQVVSDYKYLIDTGYRIPLEAALELESEMAEKQSADFNLRGI